MKQIFNVNRTIVASIKEQERLSKKNNKCYSVSFVIDTEYVLFGKKFKKTKIENVPFLFKTFDIAKDYCSIHPKIIKNTHTYSLSSFDFRYKSYRLVKNMKTIAYVKWDNVVKINMENAIDEVTYAKNTKDPIVGKFVKDIRYKGLRPYAYSNANMFTFIDEKDYLSECIDQMLERKTLSSWSFKLVENEENQ